MKKQYAIVGLGKFGFYIAKGLAENGIDIIVVDKDEEKIRELKDFVQNAYILDSTDKKALQDAGIVDLDVVLVGIGSSIEASILTVMALRDLQNKNIIAKAISVAHGEILAKIGVFKVLYPEREIAKKIVKDFLKNPLFEVIDISNTLKILKFLVTNNIDGLSVAEVEEQHQVKVASIKSNGYWNFKEIDKKYKFKKGDTVTLLGEDKIVENLYQIL
ncbi:MAG: TrkA family potassium uptake protein [Campylobacterales bacterium]|nr:TrkA family potassium uptake protein [Campylobacterales bacterium]